MFVYRTRKDRKSLERERQNAMYLRIAIVGLVVLVVIGMSAQHLYDFTHMIFTGAAERAEFIAKNVKGNLVDHLQRETAARGLHPVTLDESKQTWTEIIRGDPNVAAILNRTLGEEASTNR